MRATTRCSCSPALPWAESLRQMRNVGTRLEELMQARPNPRPGVPLRAARRRAERKGGAVPAAPAHVVMSAALVDGVSGAAGGIVATAVTYPLMTMSTRQAVSSTGEPPLDARAYPLLVLKVNLPPPPPRGSERRGRSRSPTVASSSFHFSCCRPLHPAPSTACSNGRRSARPSAVPARPPAAL